MYIITFTYIELKLIYVATLGLCHYLILFDFLLKESVVDGRETAVYQTSTQIVVVPRIVFFQCKFKKPIEACPILFG